LPRNNANWSFNITQEKFIETKEIIGKLYFNSENFQKKKKELIQRAIREKTNDLKIYLFG